jgi:hypothetical protein
MRRFLALALTALILSAACAAVPPAAADGPNNRVTLTCAFQLGQGMRKQVDPILSPGVQVSAHMHDFYGQHPVTDYMFALAPWPPIPQHENDPGYLPRATSCDLYGDWAAYWFPTPKFNGAYTLSGQLQETWQTPAGSLLHAPPFGMTYIVGNSKATSTAEEGAHFRFTCGSLDGPGFTSPQDCTGIGTVTAELVFPNCFDGQNRIANDIIDNRNTYDDPAGIPFRHFTYGDPCPTGFAPMAQLVTRQHFIDPRTGTTMVNPFNADGSLALSCNGFDTS